MPLRNTKKGKALSFNNASGSICLWKERQIKPNGTKPILLRVFSLYYAFFKYLFSYSKLFFTLAKEESFPFL